MCVTGPERLLCVGGSPYVSVALEPLQAPVVPRGPELRLPTHEGADVLHSGAREIWGPAPRFERWNNFIINMI